VRNDLLEQNKEQTAFIEAQLWNDKYLSNDWNDKYLSNDWKENK